MKRFLAEIFELHCISAHFVLNFQKTPQPEENFHDVNRTLGSVTIRNDTEQFQRNFKL